MASRDLGPSSDDERYPPRSLGPDAGSPVRRSGSRISPLYAALHPFGVGVLIYAMLRSAYTTLANDGIEWRGTMYPLELLKENV